MNYKICIIIILSLLLIYNIFMLCKLFNYLLDEPDYSICYNTKKYNIALLDNNLSNIQTGDILLFSSYIYYPIFRIFGNKIFSHIGMVVKINNEYYSLEMTDFYILNDKIYTHKSLFPLYDRINKYTGNIFISKLKNPLNYSQLNKLYNLISKSATFLNPIQLYINMIYDYKFNDKYTCSSYIYYILKELNILDNIKINNIDIHSFIIDICHNKIYANPIELLCNSSKVDKLYKKTIEYPNLLN